MSKFDDFQNSIGMWVKSATIRGISAKTVSGRAWMNMNGRCKVGSVYQAKNPTYIGCETSADFKDFQIFTEWHRRQIGYGLEDYELDKDILNAGNKIYSENTCVLAPKALNQFLCDSGAARGEWPLGVCWDKWTGRFKTSMKVGSKTVFIGRYATPEAASDAYKVAKEQEAVRWYKRLTAGEFLVDPRVIERMRTWTLDEQ